MLEPFPATAPGSSRKPGGLDMRRCIVLAIAVACCATSARADLITYTATFANRLLPPVIPAFDPALGTLEAVEIDVAGTTSDTFAASLPVSGGHYVFNLEVLLGLSIVGGAFAGGVFTLDPPAQLFWLTTDFAGRDRLEAGLDPFVGPGSLGLSFLAFMDVSATSPFADPRLTYGLTSGAIAVTYTYAAAVPEPPGWVHLSLVIGPLSLVLLPRVRRLLR
jgi:hypothetical protein